MRKASLTRRVFSIMPPARSMRSRAAFCRANSAMRSTAPLVPVMLEAPNGRSIGNPVKVPGASALTPWSGAYRTHARAVPVTGPTNRCYLDDMRPVTIGHLVAWDRPLRPVPGGGPENTTARPSSKSLRYQYLLWYPLEDSNL